MYRSLLFVFAISPSPTNAQWSYTNAPLVDRYDDVFFIGPDTGWAAGGSEGTIIRTYDGGDTWQVVFAGPGYLRSIEFATPELGFCGALDGRLLRTADGGDTWQDISSTITPPQTGVCGLSAPTPEVIYGVGVWSQPGNVIRSTDGGSSWTNTSLFGQATSLVDVLFLNADTGFVSGQAMPLSAGGVILRTEDGGDTWTTAHTTGTGSDYIWKLQTPDGVHIYGSIEGPPGNGTRFTHSADGGLTWDTDTITMDYYYIQVIGFLDALHGWTGGSGSLLETMDGGSNWTPAFIGSAYDRFHRVNDHLAYLTGSSIYKYISGTVPVGEAAARPHPEWITVQPNPGITVTQVLAAVKVNSAAQVELFSADGRFIRTLYAGTLSAGVHRFDMDVIGLANGGYFVTLRTNEGRTMSPLQIQRD